MKFLKGFLGKKEEKKDTKPVQDVTMTLPKETQHAIKSGKQYVTASTTVADAIRQYPFIEEILSAN
jgi:DNA-binding ferritin-like protein (Dps family)